MTKAFFIGGLMLLYILGRPGTIEDEVPRDTPLAEMPVKEVEVIEPITTAHLEEPKKVLLKQPATREQWLTDLEICESGGNPNALNPVDRDGTPSHGLLQFKDTTFEMYRVRYSMGEVELYDPEAQRLMVRFMMDDDAVRWEQEFPDCVRKLGRPPSR
jgi:hypothetical protein